FIQRAVATEGKEWNFGGRFDLMFGTDAIFAQAYGIPAFDVNTGLPLKRNSWDLNLCCSSSRFYNMALPQAYMEAYVPVGNGLNLKIGHFYSPTGYETVPAPDNFFYTRSYTFSNGEPFTHTGLVGNYTVNKNWAFMGGAITGSATGGWDGGWDKELSNWGGLAGTTWTSDDKKSSANLTGSYSRTSTRSNEPWGFYSLVLQHKITPKTLLVLHHTSGFAGGVFVPDGHKDITWHGVDMQLQHNLREDLSVGIRGEWFRDKDGFRVCSPVRVAQATNSVHISFAADFLATCQPADYYGVTLGMNWKPAKQLGIDSEAMQKLNIRPNIRYDRVDGIGQAYRPFDNKKDQLLISVDATIPF
ncbi:MAG: porin, partial [Candidatus Nitrotoga sp.]